MPSSLPRALHRPRRPLRSAASSSRFAHCHTARSAATSPTPHPCPLTTRTLSRQPSLAVSPHPHRVREYHRPCLVCPSPAALRSCVLAPSSPNSDARLLSPPSRSQPRPRATRRTQNGGPACTGVLVDALVPPLSTVARALATTSTTPSPRPKKISHHARAPAGDDAGPLTAPHARLCHPHLSSRCLGVPRANERDGGPALAGGMTVPLPLAAQPTPRRPQRRPPHAALHARGASFCPSVRVPWPRNNRDAALTEHPPGWVYGHAPARPTNRGAALPQLVPRAPPTWHSSPPHVRVRFALREAIGATASRHPAAAGRHHPDTARAQLRLGVPALRSTHAPCAWRATARSRKPTWAPELPRRARAGTAGTAGGDTFACPYAQPRVEPASLPNRHVPHTRGTPLPHTSGCASLCSTCDGGRRGRPSTVGLTPPSRAPSYTSAPELSPHALFSCVACLLPCQQLRPKPHSAAPRANGGPTSDLPSVTRSPLPRATPATVHASPVLLPAVLHPAA